MRNSTCRLLNGKKLFFILIQEVLVVCFNFDPSVLVYSSFFQVLYDTENK